MPEPAGADRSYTPAAGYHFLTPLYDFGVAVTTRERLWRDRLVRHMALAKGEILLDIGSGTGNLALAIAQRTDGVRYLGIDPDEAATRIARTKTAQLDPLPEFRVGFFSAPAVADWPPPSTIAICLVLHQVGMEEKARLLREVWHKLAPGGALYIADYGEQRSRLMRWLFRLTIQQLDGVHDTQPNADGLLPVLMREAGFDDIRELENFRTPTGAIGILRARKRVA
ncbi:class I SAM-dependent methyltransferase [Sphingopyxis terrae]|uniref:class I SAM-dependent methyltransferase n=1 Tax=Sphingopyxis terrae TaxID=33052 RepID=UPI002A0D7772|nr:methyltransferase [Sphingopyxis terrae]MDX8356940.1 methyltransferase domain-containing protein [Sphingopyxis terrae]